MRVARVYRRLASVVEAQLLRSWEQEDEWGVTPPWSPLIVVRIVSTTTARYLRWHPRILSYYRLVIGGVVWCQQGAQCQYSCRPEGAWRFVLAFILFNATCNGPSLQLLRYTEPGTAGWKAIEVECIKRQRWTRSITGGVQDVWFLKDLEKNRAKLTAANIRKGGIWQLGWYV